MKCVTDKNGYFYIPIIIEGAVIEIKDDYLKYKNLSLSLPRIHKLGKDMTLKDKPGTKQKIWLRFRGIPPTSEEGMINFVKNQMNIPFVEKHEIPKYTEEQNVPDLDLSKFILSEYEGQRLLGIYGKIVIGNSAFIEYD